MRRYTPLLLAAVLACEQSSRQTKAPQTLLEDTVSQAVDTESPEYKDKLKLALYGEEIYKRIFLTELYGSPNPQLPPVIDRVAKSPYVTDTLAALADGEMPVIAHRPSEFSEDCAWLPSHGFSHFPIYVIEFTKIPESDTIYSRKCQSVEDILTHEFGHYILGSLIKAPELKAEISRIFRDATRWTYKGKVPSRWYNASIWYSLDFADRSRELLAYAFEAGMKILREYKYPEEVRIQTEIYDQWVPGTKEIVDWLLKQPIFKDHPANNRSIDRDTTKQQNGIRTAKRQHSDTARNALRRSRR